jgi:hypothetical protein
MRCDRERHYPGPDLVLQAKFPGIETVICGWLARQLLR